MDKTDCFAALGLEATATSAEVEDRYLALSQYLEPKNAPPGIRQWAVRQGALIDEAYAILTADEEDEGEEDAVAARVAAPPPSTKTRQSAMPSSISRSRPATPRAEPDDYDECDDDEQAARPHRGATDAPAARKQPAAPSVRRGGVARRQQDHDDYDEYDDDDFDDDEELTAPPRRGAVAPAQSRPPVGRGWQQRGHGLANRASRPEPRQAYTAKDNRVKQVVLGLAAGLVVVALAFVAMQAGLFGGKTPDAQQPTFDQARYEQLKATVARDPKNYSALFELGEMNIDASRYEETIDWFTRVLAVRPNDVHAMQDIGTANFNLGKLSEARDIWLKALEVDPNDPQTHWNLSFYYASLTPPDTDSAMQEWQKVIDLSPGSELAKLAQSHIESYKKRSPGAPTAGTPASGAAPAKAP